MKAAVNEQAKEGQQKQSNGIPKKKPRRHIIALADALVDPIQKEHLQDASEIADAVIKRTIHALMRIVKVGQIKAAYPPREESIVVEAGGIDQRSWFIIGGMTIYWRWHLKQMACDVGFAVHAKRVAGESGHCGQDSSDEVVLAPATYRNGSIERGEWTCPGEDLNDAWQVEIVFDR